MLNFDINAPIRFSPPTPLVPGRVVLQPNRGAAARADRLPVKDSFRSMTSPCSRAGARADGLCAACPYAGSRGECR